MVEGACYKGEGVGNNGVMYRRETKSRCWKTNAKTSGNLAFGFEAVGLCCLRKRTEERSIGMCRNSKVK